MEKDLEGAAVNAEAKLEGSKKPHMDLGGHLEYIESLLEQGTGGDVSLSINITAQEMAAACSNDVSIDFESSDDVSKARELLLSGEGTIKVKVTTPLGWFNFIFYPNVCDESIANSFNFSNICVLPKDLSSIGGGSKVNVFAMRVITWNDITTVSFRFSITDFYNIIKLKTINNEPVLGDGNISVVTMADVNGAIEAAIIDAINMEY